MSASAPPELLALADAAGVATGWTDAFGAAQQTSPDSLRAILKALQLPADTDYQCRSSLATLTQPDPQRRLEPMYTAWAGHAARLPGVSLAEGTRYQITPEGGDVLQGRLEAGNDGVLQTQALTQPGYHRFEAAGQQATLAVAPPRCYSVADALAAAAHAGKSSPRNNAWGLAAQLYSLRRAHDGGIGDFTALESLVRAAAAQGASAVAISPVHAMFSAEPGRFSPYGPSSRVFFNALHIDPVKVLGGQAMDDALAQLQGSGLLASLSEPALIDWPAAARLRLAVLRHLFERFQASGDERPAFEAFCAQGGLGLRDHARFEALDAWLRSLPGQAGAAASSDWRRWPEPYRHPDSRQVAEFAQAHAQEVAFHQFLQWRAAAGREDAQNAALAAGMPIGIVADLAVGADPGGSQAWGLQSAMLQGLTVGAPPDLLATQGQNWGLGALSPRALTSQGFAPWLAMLRANLRHSGGIRIDHVLGLKRLWLVPEGQPASQGAYLRYPLEDLLRLTALESVRHKAIVIGEDLGTVPEGFSETLADAGVAGIRVLWFQRKGKAFMPPERWPAAAMATTSTHDLATLAGWWAGRDIEWRERLDLLGPDVSRAAAQAERQQDKQALWDALATADDQGHRAPLPDAPPFSEMLAFVGRTPAALVMVPLEDVLGIVEQPNLPGTVDVHPNWQQRLPGDIRALLEQAAVQARLGALKSARQRATSENSRK